MNMLILTAVLINLTGCGTVAAMYDQADDCQTGSHVQRPQGYKIPAWCGAGQGKTYIYDHRGQRIGHIK